MNLSWIGPLAVPVYVLLAACWAVAGPREFGMAEFAEAAKARGTRLQIRCELGEGAPESWRLEGPRVTGGDLRGLMYGLFEAAAQMRATGWLAMSRGSASVAVRGVRLNWDDAAKAASIEEWRGFVEMLARTRINRLQVVMEEPEKHLELVSKLSKICADYAIDFVVGFAEQPADGAAIAERVSKLVRACPLVRTLHVRVAGNKETAFHRDWIGRVAAEAGRWVNVELTGAQGIEGGSLRVARPFADDLFEARREDYLEVPSPLRMGAPVWADPMWTRYVAGVVQRSGAAGFEVEAPWPAERHWEFFLAWGRVGYDTAVGDKPLSAEFERRYGKPDSANLFQAYSAASRAFTLSTLLRPGRWVASEEESARFKKEGIASAKLRPEDVLAVGRAALADAESAMGRLKEPPQELTALMSLMRDRAGSQAVDVPAKLPARPTVQHFPPRVAPANIAFPLGLILSPVSNVRAVRLHYRVAGEAAGFHTMEAPVSRAWFDVKAGGDLTYYFEIVSRDNKGWFYPDPLAAAPYLHLPVRERKVEPPVDEAKPRP